MGVTYLTDSTKRLEDSLGGASLSNSTMLWNQNPYDETTSSTFSLKFTFNFEPGTSENLLSGSVSKRLAICLRLLFEIPEEGLDELEEAINEIIAFYKYTSEARQPDLALPKVAKIKAKLKHPSTRPEFSIMEDEV